ncbi:MAG: hypothetical protein JST16_13050 [Bdellovibrionales bacterium]|nr:hypothetical protein [Bdellovibrionales bacterium]
MKRKFQSTLLFAALPLCYVPGMGGSNLYYFSFMPSELKTRGVNFVPFDVGVMGSVQERAARLTEKIAAEVKTNPSFRCNLVAHSMGGVVSRYALAHLTVKDQNGRAQPLSRYIASLTTVSSPHLGTPYADLLRSTFPKVHTGLEQLGVVAVRIFNDPTQTQTYSPMVPGVAYYSYRTYLDKAEQASTWMSKVGFALLWQDLFFKGQSPVNDGVIPFESQSFGMPLADLRVEHSYLGDYVDTAPSVVDFLEMHSALLNGHLREFVAQQPAKWESLRTGLNIGKSALIHQYTK